MKWDFRLIKRKIGGLDFYEVHRVFYQDDAKTIPLCLETRAATVIGNGPRVMLEDIEAMVDAFDKGVLRVPEWDK